MNIIYKGHTLYIPSSGGKAGKGYNKTSHVQIRRGGMILKQFRFDVYNLPRRKQTLKDDAIQKAKMWVDNAMK